MLTAIVIIQTVYLFLIFKYCKLGTHSDEIWNYAFANSFDSKELINYNDGTSALNTWQDSSLFLDYISVKRNQRFRYDAVFNNASMDLNPPLQYFLLHTICSLFPGKFSWYFCFALNLFSFIVAQFYLYELIKQMTHSEVVAFAGVLLYGFGVGAMDIAIFLRIYALGVMFVVIFAYYSNKMYEESKEDEKKVSIRSIIFLLASCFLGAYTLHLFLLVAFCITVCLILFYLFTKKYKYFWLHGLSCLSGAVLSLLLFPTTFSHVFGAKEAHTYSMVQYPFGMQVRLYFYELTKDLFGIHVSGVPNPYLEWILGVLIFVVILAIPLCVAFRKEKWFKNIILSVQNKGKQILRKSRNVNIIWLSFLLSVLVCIFVAADRTSFYLMGVFTNRYIFVVYPLAVAFIVGSIYYSIYLISNKKAVCNIVTMVLCIIMAVWTHLIPNSRDYFIPEVREGKIVETMEDNANLIILLNEPWVLTCFAPRAYHTNSYYASNYRDFDVDEPFQHIDKGKPCYIIVNDIFILPDDISYEELAADPVMGAWAKYVKHENDFIEEFANNRNIKALKSVGKEEMMNKIFRIYEVKFR